MENNEKNSVLVVDDEKINLEVLRSILGQEYTVHMTKSGASALEMAGKYRPDLILLDIIMPDMNGFDVLETLKSSDKTRHIPVILITGLEGVEYEEKGLTLGAADFIHKPFSNKIVKSRVQHHIQIVNQIRVIEQYAQNMYLAMNKMEAIVDNYKGVIWSINTEGIITSFNGQYLKKIGVPPSFLIGKNIEAARAKNRHPDIIENIEKTFRAGPQNWQSEVDGIIFHSHTTLMHDDKGNVAGVVGSSDDVTELIKLHNGLEAAVEAAENANRTKSAFLAKMSHEIRTPLNAVLGISEIQMQDENLQHDVKEAFTRIYNSGDLLLNIINDILDMSKIEAGKLELSPSQYDVSSMINDAVFLNLIKHENKPIKFILNVDENVPSQLFGDDLRIKQILNNLLSNAFKYTASGEVELSVNAEYLSDSVTLVFRVRDTGQGMTSDQISKLFDAYSRFNLETNRTTEGTGLGMSITQNLIDMMNGEIKIESELDKGSVFTVRLPQGGTGAAALGKEAAEKLRQFSLNYKAEIKKIQITREPIPFGKVLVVDDIEMNLYVAKGMLSPYGLQIDTAESGPEAIDKIKRGTYDIVFMDHMMPVMDGIEATQEIRKLGKEYEKLPIIALTANAVSGVKEMFLASGFNGFISKPIAAQELDAMLKELLSAEKISRHTEQETQDSGKANANFFEEIGKTGEIDAEAGLNQLSGNKDMYRSTLELFYKKLISECNNMSGFLDAKDLKNFMISVHAMKSMLAIIGASALSKTALDLETASSGENIDYCAQQFPEFKEKLLSLEKKLSAIFTGAEERIESEKSGEKPKNGKVLVVDDMEMILFVINEKLSLYGLEVDTAASGQEAIEKIKGNAYDLVFMDHMMPEMDGIEAAEKVRKLGKEYEKLPIIALTANVESGVKEMFLTAGFNGYLAKPVITKELEKIFEEWLPSAVRS
jgi:PAS domain S-box-containing protein